MHISSLGLSKLIAREGSKTKAYKDSVGVLTIGVGHTSAAGPPAVTPGMTITHAEVFEILNRDIVRFEEAISGLIRVPLLQNEWDALVSFVYNIGPTGFRKSKTLALLNAGKKTEAAHAMMGWITPPEITGRRKTEVQQFLTPYSISVPLPSTATQPSVQEISPPAAATPAPTPVETSQPPSAPTPTPIHQKPSVWASLAAAYAGLMGWFHDHWLYMTLGGVLILAIVAIVWYARSKK